MSDALFVCHYNSYASVACLSYAVKCLIRKNNNA